MKPYRMIYGKHSKMIYGNPSKIELRFKLDYTPDDISIANDIFIDSTLKSDNNEYFRVTAVHVESDKIEIIADSIVGSCKKPIEIDVSYLNCNYEKVTDFDEICEVDEEEREWLIK